MTLVQRLQAMRATGWLWRECMNRTTSEVALVPIWRRVPAGYQVMRWKW